MEVDLELAEAARFGAAPFLANFGCGGSVGGVFCDGFGLGECVVAALAGGVL